MEKGKRNPPYRQAGHGRAALGSRREKMLPPRTPPGNRREKMLPPRAAPGSRRGKMSLTLAPFVSRMGKVFLSLASPGSRRGLPAAPVKAAGLSGKSLLLVPLTDFGISLWISYVLFNSAFGMVSFFPVFVLHILLQAKKDKEKAESSFDEKYREFLTGLSSGLRAGHSLENSFADAQRALTVLYGTGDSFVTELTQMNRQIGMNMPVEEVFNTFAERHPIEEVENMAEILAIGKRLGGNYVKNISDAAEKIRQSLELKAKIETLTSEKRLELNLMLILPPGMLTYIRFASPDFISPIYGTVTGVGLVCACLCAYVAAYAWGSKIVKIEV